MTTAQEGSGARELVIPELCSVKALGAVVLIDQLLVLVLLLAGGGIGWIELALTSLYVQWIGLTSAGLLCWTRRRLVVLGPLAGSLSAFAIVIGVTLILALASDRVIAGNLAATGEQIDWPRIGRHLAIAGIIAGLALRYFHLQQRLREHERSELSSRIQALQSRIRPHFLFNSMNIIASLIATEPETAETVVEDLSELFRASLKDSGNEAGLDEELALCERYMRIEGLRLGERLRMEWDVGAYPSYARIPLLTLQPLLENAVYHGIQPRAEGGTISLRLRCEGEAVAVRITNPLPPAQERRGQQGGNRMAIENIQTRLVALYGASADFEAQPEGDRFRIDLRYPLTAAQSVRDSRQQTNDDTSAQGADRR